MRLKHDGSFFLSFLCHSPKPRTLRGAAGSFAHGLRWLLQLPPPHLHPFSGPRREEEVYSCPTCGSIWGSECLGARVCAFVCVCARAAVLTLKGYLDPRPRGSGGAEQGCSWVCLPLGPVLVPQAAPQERSRSRERSGGLGTVDVGMEGVADHLVHLWSFAWRPGMPAAQQL